MRIGLQTWGSEGDLRPFVVLAAGLSRAGHDVTLALSDVGGRDHSALAARHGFRVVHVPLPRPLTPEEGGEILNAVIRAGEPAKAARLVQARVFEPLTRPAFEAARELCAAADLVVGHFCLHPLHAAAELAGTPLVKVHLAHNFLRSSELAAPGLPDPCRWLRPLGWRLLAGAVNRLFLPRVNALRAEVGLPPQRDVLSQTWVSRLLTLVAVSPAIRSAPSDWGPERHVCGFLNLPAEGEPEPMPEGLEEFLAAGDPPVYFTFGSMLPRDRDSLRETETIWLEAARLAGCRAVLQLPGLSASSLGPDGSIFRLAFAPHSRVFPRCAAVVHHGGSGTTQASLLAGRPSVAVAHMADQFFWGAELARLGAAGPGLKRLKLTSEQLARALKRVLDDPSMARRASELGAAMAREDGVAEAVRRISGFAAPFGGF